MSQKSNITDHLVLQTERLILRALQPSDLEALFAITGDPLIMQYVGDLTPYSKEKTAQVIQEAQESYRENGFGSWAFIEKTTGRLIGYGGLEYLPERAIPEVFYIFPPEQWGKGLATEVAAAILDYGFQQLNVPEIGASFDPANEPSMHVARKVGLSFDYAGLDEFQLPTIYYKMSNPHHHS
jgi:RimJ/RimL family protein N-acetyltransferase